MPNQEPSTPEDWIVEPQEVLETDEYEFTEEELAELDRRVAEADRDLAAGVIYPTAEEVFEQLRAKYRIAS